MDGGIGPQHDVEAEARLYEAREGGITDVSLGRIDAFGEPEWTGRRVRASEVRKLFDVSIESGKPFRLEGVSVVGVLSLALLETKVPFCLASCNVADGLDLDGADVATIALYACHVQPLPTGPAVAGRYATIAGDLDLKESRLAGGMDLTGARIAGSIGLQDCIISWDRQARLVAGPTGQAVSEDGARSEHPHAATDVDPGDDPEPTDLSQSWAVDLTNAELRDLSAKSSEIRGGLCISGASLSGQLNLRCSTVTSRQPDGRAVWAQRCSIGESVLANPLASNSDHHSVFAGTVDLLGCSVGGSLLFANAEIRASVPIDADVHSRMALNLSYAHVQDLLQLNDVCYPSGGRVALKSCSVGRLEGAVESFPGSRVDDASSETGEDQETDEPGPQAQPSPVSYDLAGLTYDRIDETGDKARDWIAHSVSPPPGAYLQLASAAKTRGQPADERKAKISASRAAATPLERVLLGWIRYGYRPYLVAVPLLILGVVCLLQVKHAETERSAFAPVMVDDEPVTPDDCIDAEVRCLNSALYALDSVLPIDLDQVSTWRPDTDTERGAALSRILVVNQLAGWLLAGVLVAAVAGLLNRA